MSALTPTSTRALLRQLDIRPKKKLGQNFLIDPNITRKSIHLAEVKAGDRVVEVGPGLGTLTRELLDSGATVYAVEKDDQLFTYLNQSEPFHTQAGTGRFNLIHGDAMDHPLAGLTSEIETGKGNLAGFPVKNYKIVANLPYAISSPWLEEVLSMPLLPERMVLMVQKEAAQRYTAQSATKSVGAVSIFLQSAYECRMAHRVSPKCFYPEPAVASVLLVLTKKEQAFCFSSETRILIRNLFQHRRKQLSFFAGREVRLKKWIEQLEEQGIKPTERAENLPLPCFQILEELIQ